eukprot:3025635-Rhodomonas_salina.2
MRYLVLRARMVLPERSYQSAATRLSPAVARVCSYLSSYAIMPIFLRATYYRSTSCQLSHYALLPIFLRAPTYLPARHLSSYAIVPTFLSAAAYCPTRFHLCSMLLKPAYSLLGDA